MSIVDLFPGPADREWMERAACRGSDPTIFFPEVGGNDHADPAKAICAQCRVQPQCLEYALANRERYGIFGGYSEKERRQIIRKRQRDRLARERAS